MLNQALKYLSVGFSVIPLCYPIEQGKKCSHWLKGSHKAGHKIGKTPIYYWDEYKTKPPSASEVEKWWNAAPNANIGIVTGKLSNLTVVDLDGPEGLASAQSLGLVSSLVSLTGNGRQLFYKWTSETKNSVRSYPGLDVRGDGGYVVAPPSIHPSGRRYRWATVMNVENLPSFPSEILMTSVESASQAKTFKEQGWVSKALQEMTNGNIDVTLFTICSRLRADGYSPDDARILLAPHAARVGAEAGHLDEKIENVWNRYDSRQKPLSAMFSSPTERSEGGAMGELIIHSPTNPDSIKQFEQRKLDVQCGTEQLQTGYPKLDRMLTGGLKSSRLFTVAARTGVGKTNWLLGAVRSLCSNGKRVLLFSTEMPYEEIWARYLATLNDPEEFKNHQFFVCDSFAPNIEKVEEAIKEIKPDVFMFDHINHVSEEQRELGSFMQGLNFLRRKYECAGIVTAQLNRSADWVDLKTGEKVTPRMSMIKGSGTIEQASSRVLLLSETRVTPEMTEIVGNLDKNDNGPKGLLHFGMMNNPYRMIEL